MFLNGIMGMLPMTAYHPGKMNNFVGKAGILKTQDGNNTREFPKPGSGFSNHSQQATVADNLRILFINIYFALGFRVSLFIGSTESIYSRLTLFFTDCTFLSQIA